MPRGLHPGAHASRHPSRAAQFGPWLRRIALNLARNAYRSAERQPLPLDFDVADESGSSNHGATQVDEGRLLVRKALSKLSATPRQVIDYHCLKGYSHRETPKHVGATPAQANSRLQKARQRLRLEVAGMGEMA